MNAIATRRKFVLTDLVNNNNKEYTIVDNGDGTFTATWGRVGGGVQTKKYVGGGRQIDRIIDEKLRKGYVELDLHEVKPAGTPATTSYVSGAHPAVNTLLQDLSQEAGNYIKTYLRVNVDALSLGQVNRGRDILTGVAKAYQNYTAQSSSDELWSDLVAQMQRFYNTIPTILPHNLRDASVLSSTIIRFCEKMGEQEERLDQLEAAISSLAVQTNNANTGQNNSLLGTTNVTFVDHASAEYKRIAAFFQQASIRIREVFEITIPSEREAFEKNTFGAHKVMELTHGSRMANFRHILMEKGAGSGLRIPSQYTNGWMFGPGLYFADNAAKSQNYCSSNRNYNIIVLSSVAVGDMYKARGSESNLKAAPHPYHSTLGGAGFTSSWAGSLLRNEYIVYKQEQQSIRYLVTF